MSVRACILIRMDAKVPPSLRRVIAEQAGVVSRRQLLRAGVSRTTIDSKHKRGLWQQIHPGVYGTFTGTAAREAHLWAAALYAGPGALLSHETAAEVLGLTDRRCPVIQVTIPASRRVRPPEGMAIHRSNFDYPAWRPQRGIPPHTFYAETILDLVAAADNLDDVVAWVSQGIARNLVSEAQLKSAVAARRRFRWRAQIDEVIELVAGGSHFPLEFRYDRDVARAHGLPAATKQARFAKADGARGFRDRCYQKYGLIVELDGGQDRLRDNEAAATTGATLRYQWADVDRAPCETAGQVYRALRLRGYLGPIRPCSAACRALAASRPNANRLHHQSGVLPR
jgi:putative AbiEi antitoxin of type IV toxin-antitoxin system